MKQKNNTPQPNPSVQPGKEFPIEIEPKSFYSLSFIDVFRRMGKKKMFMIRTMTDETYAVNCSIDKENPDREEMMYYVALFSKSYWVIGTFIGGIAGQLIPYDLTGIDFCMTALFVILFIDQWEKTPDHRPALLGLGISLICLILFGTMSFMLPSLLLTSGILLVMLQMRKGAEK